MMARAIPRRTAPRTTTAHVARRQDQWRGTNKERDLGHQWTKVAKLRRSLDGGVCQECAAEDEAEGTVMRSIASRADSDHELDVDHIIPRHVRPDWAYELENTMTLCRVHHKRKTDKDNQQYGSSTTDESRLTSFQRANRQKARMLPYPR